MPHDDLCAGMMLLRSCFTYLATLAHAGYNGEPQHIQSDPESARRVLQESWSPCSGDALNLTGSKSTDRFSYITVSAMHSVHRCAALASCLTGPSGHRHEIPALEPHIPGCVRVRWLQRDDTARAV
jgi:hypothetical protein